MSGEITVPKEKCMKVTFPRDERIIRMFKGLPPIFRFEEEGDSVTVYCPVGCEIRREHYDLTLLQFKRICNKLRVENGRKLWKGDSLILDPAKRAMLRFRLSRSELALVKSMAARSGESLTDYVCSAIFTRMARELGL